MNRFPREPLDADERALAAQLPRPHGRGEPDAALDARILAAAHAASQAAPATRRRNGRWAVPLGLAASLCLALGLVWRVQMAPQPVPATATADAAAAPAAAPVAFIAPPPEQEEAAPAPPPATQKPRLPAPAPRQAPSPVLAAPAALPEAADQAPAGPPQVAAARHVTAEALPPPPPPPPPAPPAPPAAVAAVAPAAIPADAGEPAPLARARRAESAKRAAGMQADAPEDDIPPATADSPDVRDAWLRRIGELMRKGRIDEARASLTEFRRRYPDATLPAEFRPLEQPEP